MGPCIGVAYGEQRICWRRVVGEEYLGSVTAIEKGAAMARRRRGCDVIK